MNSAATYVLRPVTVLALTAMKNASMTAMFLAGYRIIIPRMLSPKTKASGERNACLDSQNLFPQIAA